MKTALLLAALLSVTTAQAGSFCTDSSRKDIDLPCKVNDTDNYVGFGVGQSVPYAANHSATAKAFGSWHGVIGRRISDNFAVEGAYIRLGSFYNTKTSQTTNVDVYSLTLFGKYPLDEDHYFSIYGRGGYASSVVNLVPVGNNWHGDITYGGGLEFTFSSPEERNWYIRIGMDQYNTGALTVVPSGGYASKDWVDTYTATLLLNF